MSIIEDFEEIRQLIGRIGSFDSRISIKRADDTAYYQLAEADLKLKKFSKQLQSLQTKLQQAKEGFRKIIEFAENVEPYEEMPNLSMSGDVAQEILEIINK